MMYDKGMIKTITFSRAKQKKEEGVKP